MPLYGRRLFHPPSTQSQGSFVIQHTGQTFDQADIYQKLLQIYALERWTCECTWRASLTHAEAFRSEIETRKTLTNLVAEHFYKPIFDVIHHNVKPLEKLAEEVSIVLNQSFVLGEPVQFRKKRKDSEVLKGMIERIDDLDESKKRPSTPSSEKQMKNVKYTVRLLDADGTMIEDVLPSELQRTFSVPNREKLKTFIRSFAIRLGTRADSPWIFYDHSIVSRYQIASRLPSAIVEQFKKSMTITVEEIVREHERLARKQAEMIVPTPLIAESTNDDDDDQVIILSDDEDLMTKPSTIKQGVCDVVIPRTMLNRLEKIRLERGSDSRSFQRFILQCARTLTDEQREYFPHEYRKLIENKIEELTLKQRISQMTDEEKKEFFQTKRDEQKPIEDLELNSSKSLVEGNEIENPFNLSMDSIGDLLMIGTFVNSCQTLFTRTSNDDLNKFTQQYLRSFRIETFLKTFRQSFGKLSQIFIRLLLKEEENRTNLDDDDDDDDESSKDTNNNSQPNDLNEIYSTKLIDIPLNSSTCQELIRLYLIKNRSKSTLIDRLSTCEFDQLTNDEQIELLKTLVETISTNNEIINDYHEYLNGILADASRERQQRREEKKLQLQNENKPKKTTDLNENSSTNDEIEPMNPSNDENDLKMVLQRRRQMLAVSKELKEKKEQENHKLQLEQRKQIALNRAEQTYQDALLNVQQSFRLKPLGYDRFYNRYWFFRGFAGVFVEKNWIETSSQWFIYDDESKIVEFSQSLNDRGIREHHLLLNLKKTMPLIQQEFEQMKKTNPPNNNDEDDDENIVASFRSELEEIESRLRLGSLGGWMNNLDELNQWQKRLTKANERNQLADLLIELEETVPDKYSSGIFNHSDKKSLQLWMNDCRTCSTYSRLYVLMMIFENAIQWKKSPVGMKCKVCRKKYKDESMFVCDQCSHAYHPQCLNIVRTINNDLWFCPACRPEIQSTRRHRQQSSSDEQQSSSSTDSSMSDDEPRCSVCGSDGEIFSCCQCEQFYHCDCHQPPLRCAPRSNRWLCNNCRNGSKTTKTKAKTTKRKKPKIISQRRRRSKRLRQSASSSDEEQSMDESDH